VRGVKQGMCLFGQSSESVQDESKRCRGPEVGRRWVQMSSGGPKYSERFLVVSPCPTSTVDSRLSAVMVGRIGADKPKYTYTSQIYRYKINWCRSLVLQRLYWSLC
jgi:hypothetical protein